MSITIVQEPENIYPAYNDCFIIFSSDLADNYKAEITFSPVATFPKKHVVYPIEGLYTINLKEIAKVQLNENGFSDVNFFTDDWYKIIEGIFLNQTFSIEVFSDITSEITVESVQFYKAVKQIGESLNSNPYQLLTYTKDGVNHKLTYFEGFPFYFDILYVGAVSDREIIVKSLNTNNTTPPMLVDDYGSFRINIDRGNNINWTLENYLPLIVGENRLEIYEDDVFKANLLLTKRKVCNGVYLKWFNSNGGYSHFLFDEFFTERTAGAEQSRVLNNTFENINELDSSGKITGKEATSVLSVRAKFDSDEYEIMKDLIKSPLIQMYTSKEAYTEGEFIDVFIDGTILYSNKKAINEIVLNIELPSVITAKL